MPSSSPLVLAHGGVGAPREWSDGCEAACARGCEALADAGALAAAIEATVVLEDDERFNAGTGSNFRLDGATIEMDAAVMDHDLRFGAVAAIQKVRNPVRVAARVAETPHLMLAGEGATAFARRLGIPEHVPVSERARRKYARVRERLAGAVGADPIPGWEGADPGRWWNFEAGIREALRRDAGPSDTVGAVARDGDGRCAAALSTGGTAVMLLGRVGDTPIPGGGIYAGPAGAVVATGQGEEIMRRVVAYRVYAWIEEGLPVAEAVARGLALVPERFDVGLLAVSPREDAAGDNRTMPWARREAS